MMNRLDKVVLIAALVVGYVLAGLLGIVLFWDWDQASVPVPSETTVIKQRMQRIEEEFFAIKKRFGKVEQRCVDIENEVFPRDERFGKNEKE